MSRRARGGEETRQGRYEMSISAPDTATTCTPPREERAPGTPASTPGAERGREFWHRTLSAGAFIALPRWTRAPASGVREHEARIPGEVVAGGGRGGGGGGGGPTVGL